MKPSRLLIVDDDMMICELLATVAEDIFEQIQLYNDAAGFLQQTTYAQDVILLDLQMPQIDGIETIRLLAQQGSKASILLMSGYDESVLRSAKVLAKDLGLNVMGDLTKPIGIAHLTKVLNELAGAIDCEQPSDERSSGNDPHAFIPTAEDLLKAINEHQLELHYQPQVSLKSNALVGAEALVRWNHPEFGMIYPDRFIPLAESSGLIGELTEAVINLAVIQSHQWHKQGYAFKVSVNISAQNVSSLDMPEYLEALARRYELDTHMLVLELTESAVMSEITTSLDILTRLRLKGFRLSIDDFGTGFSSLSQLHKIPFTELKIDQSFVMKMIEDPQSAAIVETCIMLGHKLRMSVVAEGVEDHQIWQRLKELGCDIAQGYHISRPMAPEAFLSWYQGITRMRGLNVTELKRERV